MQYELVDLIKIAKKTLSEVESSGWTVGVHTNCLAILRSLAHTKLPQSGSKGDS